MILFDAEEPKPAPVDYILEGMKRDRVPLTRENYLDIAYVGKPPYPLSAEQEAELPEEFQQEPDDPDNKVGPTDFQAEVEKLHADGKLPPLDDLLSAVAETRKKYATKIRKAREEPPTH